MDRQEELVYLDDTTGLAPFDGYVYAAIVVAEEEDEVQVQILTDTLGQEVATPSLVHVSWDRILSLRPYRDLFLPYFYYFAPSGEDVIGTNFVDKTQSTQPLTRTSRSALGSGVYGLYLTNPQEIEEFRSPPEQEVYQVECEAPFFVQDKEHGVSLSFASYSTNAFVEDLLLELQIMIEPADITHLVRLWNFVLLRAQVELIDEEWLALVLNSYLERYRSTMIRSGSTRGTRSSRSTLSSRSYSPSEDSSPLRDVITNVPLEVLPINDIMQALGYSEIVASDVYNNGWDRGCVSFRQELITSARAGKAKY
jgi:hypothetical protein